MKAETRDTMTDRVLIHNLVEVIEDEYLDDVRWLIQGFAAMCLNKRTEENKQNED